MANKNQMVEFTESTSRYRQQSITIPNLKKVIGVSVNTGTASHTVSGNNVTITVDNGTHTRYETSSYTPTITGTATRSTSPGGDPSDLQNSLTAAEAGYNGYTGTLTGGTATVVSGSYTPANSKSITTYRTTSKDHYYKWTGTDWVWSRTTGDDLPSQVEYNAMGYSGTLPKVSGRGNGATYNPKPANPTVGQEHVAYTDSVTGTYTGTVTKPASDTRVWQKSYSGTLTGSTQYSTTYYYAYTVTVTYEDNTGQTITVTSPLNNQTLSEGATLQITGTTTEPDNGDIVTVKYRVHNQPIQTLKTASSDGVTPISFNKTLTFSGGKLLDGTTDISGLLAENTTHTLTIWSEDNTGGASILVNRSFAVTLNRAPVVNVNTFASARNGLVEQETITFTGTVSDPEGNTVTMTYKINGGNAKTLAVNNGAWSLSFKVSDLVDGTNNIIIDAVDQFQAKSTKTLTINRTKSGTPLKAAHARYKIIPPNGTTREIVAWLLREKGDLVIDGALSIVANGQPESYSAMAKTSTDISTTTAEDQLIGTVTTAQSDVVLKFTLTSTDANATQGATSLMGAIK